MGMVLFRAGSYVRAAQALHISQPALSQQMSDLSAALGVAGDLLKVHSKLS